MELAPRQQEEAVGPRVARTARGMAIAATRPFVRAARGAVVGAIDRYCQMVVGTASVFLRGIRNEVVGGIDNTLGLPGGGIPVPDAGTVEEAAPIAEIVREGNGEALADRPQYGGVFRVWLMRVFVGALLFLAGAVSHATWGASGGNAVAGVSARGQGGAGDMAGIETNPARMIDVRDEAMADLPKGQVSSGDGNNEFTDFFARPFKTDPLNGADVKKLPALDVGHDEVEGNRPLVSGGKGKSMRGPFKGFRWATRRVNTWRANNRDKADAFLQGPWVD